MTKETKNKSVKKLNKENCEKFFVKNALKNLSMCYVASKGAQRHQANILRLIESYQKKKNAD